MTESTLRLITCGSVDDGKSTLIGRMLHDCGAIADDLVERLAMDSKRFGTQGSELDFALLADGLEAEREQGITIDVAYRYFSAGGRRFVLADTPGHEQYTANMVTGASTADLAIVLVDASKGILQQTRRHSYLADLMGIRNIVLAVNKMDLVGWDQAVFEEIDRTYRDFAAGLDIEDIFSVPISALSGANLAARSDEAPWYDGPPLLQYLKEVEIAGSGIAASSFRMPVQWVNRPNDKFRGFSGTIAGGSVRPGDSLVVLPANKAVDIDRIVTGNGDREAAIAGEAVTLVFKQEVECSRGSVLSSAAQTPSVADQFEAVIIWLSDDELQPGRQYLLKLATQTVVAIVQKPKYEVNVDTFEHLAAKTLHLNGIGVTNIWTDRPIVFEPYEKNRTLGGFILIDRFSNATVSAGLVNFPLRRSIHVHEQALEVTSERRAALKFQRPKLIWFTGISGAGKSTIANIVERKLNAAGRHTFLLDGDNIRMGLNRDLGFTDADRIENIRRVGETAKLMMEAGLIVLAAFISPFRADRKMVRDLVPEGDFIEVFVETTLEEAESRDVKGLYRKARAGKLPNFTGIDSPYEAPENPDIRLDTSLHTPEAAADIVIDFIADLISPDDGAAL